MLRSKFARMLLISATGSVKVLASVSMIETATSSIETAKAKIAPLTMLVRASGRVTSQKARRSVAPRIRAASVSDRSMPERPARVARIV